MPTGEIGQARSHREVLPTSPPEVSHQQDLDTNPSQIWKSQQVSQTEAKEIVEQKIPTRWRTVKAHRTSLKTFPPGSQWTKVAEPNKGMRTAKSNLSKVPDLKMCPTPTANCSSIISINASTLLLFFPTFYNWWFLSPDTTRQGFGASGCSTRKICSLLQMGL